MRFFAVATILAALASGLIGCGDSDHPLESIAVVVLRALGLLASDDARLAARARPSVTNARGLVTGEIVATLELVRREGEQ